VSEGALDMMWALRLESGVMWGEAARDSGWELPDDHRTVQVRDAEEVFGDDRPHWHFITRPRGGSKSSDTAGIALSWLVMDAPPLANGHIVAASTDQAAIIIDAIAGFVARTPELDGAVVVESKRVLAPNGAWVEILAQSDSGSWGLRDAHLLVCDEFCQWPETRGAKRVWSAMLSTAPKVPNCKLIILSSAGEPSHWSHEVFEKCEIDPMWRVSEAPGPVPWLNAQELESLRFQLRPSEYDRLVLNIWAQDEDRAVSEEDWAHAAKDYVSLLPRPGVKYIMLVDIGILNDATVVTVMHKERIEKDKALGPHKVVVDHIQRWKGSKTKPVRVGEVEDWIVSEAPKWNRAAVYADPSQFMGNIQNLNRRGVRAKEFKFSTSSVGEVATALVQVFRNRQIDVPDILTLKDELLRVRLRESSPGVTRLDHERGAHDDQAVTIGMGCRLLLGGVGGVGANFREFMARGIEERGSMSADEREVVESKKAAERQVNGRRESVRSDRRRAVVRCQHRWNPDRTYCLFCDTPNPEGETPMEVAADPQAAAVAGG
jgi:hypothetical protein